MLIPIVIFTVLLPLAAILFILLNRDSIAKINNVSTKNNASTKKAKSIKSNAKLYTKISGFPLIGNYLSSIKSRLAASYVLDENTLRKKALNVFIVALLVSIFTYILSVKLYGSSLYMRAVMLLFSIYLGNFAAEALSGSKSKLLENLTEFINDIKHHYHATWMVDESIYEATLVSSPEMEKHGRELYKVVTSSKSEKELEYYYENSRNKFLKILAGFSYMVKEYGDRKINGVSLYIKNLNYIIEEIYLEIVRKSQIEYWLKGLPVIAIVPILFPPWIEKWMSDSFPASSEFFQSSAAFFLKNIILFLVAICYVLLLQLKGTDTNKGFEKNNIKPIEQYLLGVKTIKDILKKWIPKTGSETYKKQVKLIGDSGAFISLEAFYLRRLLCGVGAFLIFVTIFTAAHRVNINSIMNNATYGIKKSNLYQMLGKLSTEEKASRDSINKYDREISKFIDNKIKKLSQDKALKAIKAILEDKDYELGDTEIAAERIYSKMTAKKKEHIKLWELLLSIFTAYIFSFIPTWLTYFRKSLRKADMQDEVFQFHTVILLLMHHESVDVRKILEWMYQLSDVFRQPINRCLNNFQDPKAALARLKEDVKFKEFTYLIENLEMASDKITIREAFDSLELDRDFYRENRKEVNKRSVNNRIELGKLIGFLPFYAVIILYLVIPLLIVSVTSLKAIVEQLGIS